MLTMMMVTKVMMVIRNIEHDGDADGGDDDDHHDER